MSVDKKIEILTVVIPTKDRPMSLAAALNSVFSQTRLPDDIIIVDQSCNSQSKDLVLSLLSGRFPGEMNYVHDPLIRGLVEAKSVAVKRCRGDLICFLDDDVVLEENYIEQIEKGFKDDKSMMGCCGIITNPPKISKVYRLLFKIFHRGIFKDERIDIFGDYSVPDKNLVKSRMLSGGASAWRSELFNYISFDVFNSFHMLEDIDFSTRAARFYGPCFYINLNARLEHNHPLRKDINFEILYRQKLIEYIIYYKKRSSWEHANISVLWMLVGLFFESTWKSMTLRSMAPVKGFIVGLHEGMQKKVVVF